MSAEYIYIFFSFEREKKNEKLYSVLMVCDKQKNNNSYGLAIIQIYGSSSIPVSLSHLEI